jgi:hypothetical protein
MKLEIAEQSKDQKFKIITGVKDNSSIVECLLSMHRNLGSSTSTAKKNNKKSKTKKGKIHTKITELKEKKKEQILKNT